MLFAASVFDVKYPVADLGNCASREECKIFCDTPDNELTCLRWAEDNGFAPKPTPKPRNQPDQNQDKNQGLDSERGGNEQQRIRDEEAFKNAPGGCKAPRECDVYCRVEENLTECLDYSVKYGYTTREEADKIIAQSKKGGPGGCKGPTECDAFCRQPANARACMQFVVDEGKITQEEADIMVTQMEKGPMKSKRPGEGNESGEPKMNKEKAMEILKTKAGPGGCASEEACKTYCDGSNHMQECMNFAKENALMSDDDLKKMEKLSRGGPGGCEGPEECDAFCGKEENRDTCFNFSKENGLMSEEEIGMMEKQMSIIKKLDKQAGPGGCKTREECDSFCRNPNNIETCINFSGQQGMISPETAQQMMGQSGEAKQKMQEFQNFQQGMMTPPQDQNGNFFRPPANCPDGKCPPPMPNEQYGQPPPGCEDGKCSPPPEVQYMMPPKDCPDGQCGPNSEDGQYIMAPGTSGGPSGQYIVPGNQPMPPIQQMPPQGGGSYPPPETGATGGQYIQYNMQPPPGAPDGQYPPPMPPQGTMMPSTSGTNLPPPPPPPITLKIKNFLAGAMAFLMGK